MKIHLELEILQMFDLISTFYIRRYTDMQIYTQNITMIKVT